MTRKKFETKREKAGKFTTEGEKLTRKKIKMKRAKERWKDNRHELYVRNNTWSFSLVAVPGFSSFAAMAV